MTGRDARKILQAAHDARMDSPAEKSRSYPGKSLKEAYAICYAACAHVHPQGKIRPVVEQAIETDFVRASHSRRGQ
jgi:hypothetical protein